MRSYRIVLEYTENTYNNSHPEEWDWYALFDIGTNEALSVVSIQEIKTPAGHWEDMMQDAVPDAGETR